MGMEPKPGELLSGELRPGLTDNYWNREIAKSEYHRNMFNNTKPCVIEFSLYEPLDYSNSVSPPTLKPVCSTPFKQDYLNNNNMAPLPKLELDNLSKKIEAGLKDIVNVQKQEFKPPKFKLPEYKLPDSITGQINQAAQEATATLFAAIKNDPLFKANAPKPDIEVSPVKKGNSEDVYKGFGHTHFSFEHHDKFHGFHVTTQLPDIKFDVVTKEGKKITKMFSLHERIKFDVENNELSFHPIDVIKKTRKIEL